MKTLTIKEVLEELDVRIKEERDSIKLQGQEILDLRRDLEILYDLKKDIKVNIDNIFNKRKIK